MIEYFSYIDKELYSEIAEGDEKAFTVFFEYHYPRLKPFISRFFSDTDQAEDALQETFIRVWLNRDQLPAIKNVPAWLHTISSRICLNAMRKDLAQRNYAAQHPVQHITPPTTPADVLSAAEIGRLVADAIDKMPDARRRIYLLSREEGMKPAQIADTLTISVSTVKNTLVTALKDIRNHLTANGHIISLILLLKKYL